MTFDPTEFLRVANALAEHSDEASLRTAVGRAYYSVFLQARERLGIRGQRRHIHGLVIAGLRRVDRKVGDQLDKLEKLRGTADYELEVEDPFHQDWHYNWRSAFNYATYVSKRLQTL
jgi:uncharacterized protein (UPF0332 family)